jgi:Polyketide cyclase / dehydrase and lipid transport
MAAGGSARIQIDATPEEVYDLVADIGRMGEWSPETFKAHWLGGADHAQTGARFRGWHKIGPVRWATDPIVECAERGKELCFTTTVLGRGRFTTWTYRMHPGASGGTELEESWEQVGSIPLVTNLMNSERRTQMMQQGMEATLERIKAAAERR